MAHSNDGDVNHKLDTILDKIEELTEAHAALHNEFKHLAKQQKLIFSTAKEMHESQEEIEDGYDDIRRQFRQIQRQQKNLTLTLTAGDHCGHHPHHAHHGK